MGYKAIVRNFIIGMGGVLNVGGNLYFEDHKPKTDAEIQNELFQRRSQIQREIYTGVGNQLPHIVKNG